MSWVALTTVVGSDDGFESRPRRSTTAAPTGGSLAGGAVAVESGAVARVAGVQRGGAGGASRSAVREIHRPALPACVGARGARRFGCCRDGRRGGRRHRVDRSGASGSAEHSVPVDDLPLRFGQCDRP